MDTKRLAATLLVTAALVGGSVSAATASGPVTGTGTGSGANGIPAHSVIHFAHGATSATVSGEVGPGEDDRYVFDAKAGQIATFHLARSTSAQTWTLVGPSGPAVHDAHSRRQSDFTYRLPESGRYHVDIVSTRPSSYRLQLSIPATTTPGTTKSANQSDVTVTLPTTGLYRIDVSDAVHSGAQQLTLSIRR
ncbi:hypothetical protein [Kineococcus sp. SYSU DK006]|uniref:hypothetical protein n=1 Tax=Kineococcus sp. SYSU DK006 TaxID=3383127 RepID=UPI003D7C3F8D